MNSPNQPPAVLPQIFLYGPDGVGAELNFPGT